MITGDFATAMNFRERMKQIAMELSNSLQTRDAQLKREQASLELQLGRIKVQRDLISGSFQRAVDFQPHVGADLWCPKCWIVLDKRLRLFPIPSNSHEDLFRCDICQFEISIPRE